MVARQAKNPGEAVNHQTIASKLNATQRTLLISHVDGAAEVKVPIVVGEVYQARTSLIRAGLIGWPNGTIRPSYTQITSDGRQVLCYVLAEAIEAIVRAGFGVLEPENPLARDKWLNAMHRDVGKLA